MHQHVMAQRDVQKGAVNGAGANLDDDHDDWVNWEEEEEEEETETPTEKKDTNKGVAEETKEEKDKEKDDNDEEAEDEGEWEETDDDVSVDEDDTVRAMQAKRDNKYPLAGLNCDASGGPARDVAQEMVYWEDIPQDSIKVSPFFKQANTTSNGKALPRQFMTFEMDSGGWNNNRMAMETMLVSFKENSKVFIHCQ